MISLFYARHYPAGREVKPDNQPVPNDAPVFDTNGSTNDSQLSGVPPMDRVPASSNDPNLTPTEVPSQPSDVPDSSQSSDSPPPTTIPVQNSSPLELTAVPDNEPASGDQHPPADNESPPTSFNDNPPHLSKKEDAPALSSPQPTQTDYFVPSSALNDPQPMATQSLGTDITPTPSLTTVSIHDLPASSTVTTSTDTLQPTPTTVSTQGAALSTLSSNRKYIIGGAVGGGVLVLILLALLWFCCRKPRAKRDLERSGGHSEGQPGYGQFACCSHGICNGKNGQPQVEQKTPLKPFRLRSDPVVLTPKEGQQRHMVSLNRRDSTESRESAGSDASSGSSYSVDSEGSQRGRRRSQKRPPPLKLTSLVTPAVHGPQDNPRQRVGRSSLPNPHRVPAIVV